MNREEAIRHIESSGYVIEPDQPFVVDRFRPEDAWGTIRLVHAVYGRSYPFDAGYIPEEIIEGNGNGDMHHVVARTEKGDIVAQGVLFRTSSHYPGVYECGQGVTLPAYRETPAFISIFQYIMEVLPRNLPVHEITGEPSCNHTTSQKLMVRMGSRFTALEVDLMPGAVYAREGTVSPRVPCFIGSRSYRDRRQKMYIPREYLKEMDFICSDLSISREKESSGHWPPAAPATDLTHQVFEQAGVARFNVVGLGKDFARTTGAMESMARRKGCCVLQFFLNMGESRVGFGVEVLRERGYFLGGLVPRWFDSDALLMQKVITVPDFSSIRAFSDKAKALVDLVHKDWGRAAVRFS